MSLSIKSSNVAGSFYPEDPIVLQDMINDFLDQVTKQDWGVLMGIIAPHAGYIYSGLTVAHAYKQLIGQKKKRAWILAPSHFSYLEGVAVGNFKAMQTPLGEVPVDTELTEKLLIEDQCKDFPEAYKKEHAIEVQLPFLQTVLPDIKIIPMLLGRVDFRKVAEILKKYLTIDDVFIISSDLSHFHDYEQAIVLDKSCLDSILAVNTDLMINKEACGKVPILTLMWLAQNYNWHFKLIDYRNSGDTVGDKDRVVGYGAMVITA